jgi:hypothetical protein
MRGSRVHNSSCGVPSHVPAMPSFAASVCLSAVAAVAASQPINIAVDWTSVIRTSRTTTTLQTVVNPLITRGSPVHDQIFASLAALNAQRQRFVPWLPYPRLGVAELEPPSGPALCGFTEGQNWAITLTCPQGVISEVQFASYGTPSGFCGGLKVGSCNAPTSMSVVQAACLNQASCTLNSSDAFFGGADPCYGE